MGQVVEGPSHWRATSAGSGGVPARNSSSGKPVARLKRAASEKDGARQPVSMRETVATVVPAASATSFSDNSLAFRWARSGCIELPLPRWKETGQQKLSIADKDASAAETYAPAMVTRIGPRKPRDRAKLKEWRDSRGWSQEKLAGFLDTTGATISRYESGSRDYPGGFLAAVAEVFGVQEGDLYRLPAPQSEVPQPPSLDAMVRHAPPAIQELARKIIQDLIDSFDQPAVARNTRKETGT